MKRLVVFSALLFGAFCISVKADSIPITFNLTDGRAKVVGSTDTTLTLERHFDGSVLSGDPSLNAVWNPVSYSDLTVGDENTGFLNGSFSLVFANGGVLSGDIFEDASAIFASPTGTGPFTLALTFTGGMGEFAGATGSASGNGIVATVGTENIGTASGSGTINVQATPEPASVALLLGGLGLMIAGAWRRKERLLTRHRRKEREMVSERSSGRY